MADNIKVLGMPAESGRWVLVIVGMVIQLCLGAIYAYGVIRVPLTDYYNELGLNGKRNGYDLAIYCVLIVVRAYHAHGRALHPEDGAEKGVHGRRSACGNRLDRSLIRHLAAYARHPVRHYRRCGRRHSLRLSNCRLSAMVPG